MIQKIENLEDIVEFMHTLIEEGVNAHPDDDFRNYVNFETGADTFTESEADHRNELMETSFDICENEGVDIYSFMQEIFLKDIGMDQFIPLPSTIR